MMSIIRVHKLDGAIENWDRDKVVNSVAAAGASPMEAESIATLVEIWCEKVAINQVISSHDIREKVIELMRCVHPQAAEEFEYFKKIT